MSIVAHSRPFVVGVDTHAKTHVYATIATATGALLQTRDFPTTSAGITRALAWVARLTGADLATLWVIEGADKGLERGKVEAWIRPQFGRKSSK